MKTSGFEVQDVENKFDYFWSVMDLCDWEQEGDDDAVLSPVIEYLSQQDDDMIFKFEDLMSELLYNLDNESNYKLCEIRDENTNDDTFLYSRCVALINGPEYYNNVLVGKEQSLWDMEFESMLYVAMEAWALKYDADPLDFPHKSPLSYETRSNESGW